MGVERRSVNYCILTLAVIFPQKNDYSASTGLTAPGYFGAAAPRIQELAAALMKPRDDDAANVFIRHVREVITTGAVHPLRTAILAAAFGARVAVEASGDRALVRRGFVCVGVFAMRGNLPRCYHGQTPAEVKLAENIFFGCGVMALTAALSPIADRSAELASDAVDGLRRLCLPTTGAWTLLGCAYACPEMSAADRTAIIAQGHALLRFDGVPASLGAQSVLAERATALFTDPATLLPPHDAGSPTIALARSVEAMWAALSPEATAQRAAPTAVCNEPLAARGAGPPPPPPQALQPGINCPGTI